MNAFLLWTISGQIVAMLSTRYKWSTHSFLRTSNSLLKQASLILPRLLHHFIFTSSLSCLMARDCSYTSTLVYCHENLLGKHEVKWVLFVLQKVSGVVSITELQLLGATPLYPPSELGHQFWYWGPRLWEDETDSGSSSKHHIYMLGRSQWILGVLCVVPAQSAERLSRPHHFGMPTLCMYVCMCVFNVRQFIWWYMSRSQVNASLFISLCLWNENITYIKRYGSTS